MEAVHRLDPFFLTTRETFPGEKPFAELAAAFFASGDPAPRAARVAELHAAGRLLVHMANPEQIDDLFAHIDREKRVRYLSTSCLHRDVRATVYAIGRGTGLLLDAEALAVDHVSVKDSDTETDPHGELVVDDRARVSTLGELHAALLAGPSDGWNEVNVSFEGPGPILGLFALDGVLSKLYGAALSLKAGGRLPLFTYNRESNRLAPFQATPSSLGILAAQVSAPHLRERFQALAAALAAA